MRNPANAFLLPFVLLGLVFLYLAWEFDPAWAKWAVPNLVLAAFIYVSSPQINWRWWQRYPPELEPDFRALLEQHLPFYRNLPEMEQRKFRARMFLFREGTDWHPVAWKEEAVPEDVKIAIAAAAVQLTFGQKRFLFERFEKVVVYPKPFLSPEHPYPHAAELFEPDGCLIFSAEQVMRAFMERGQYYNVALHEYARAFVLAHPNEPWPNFEQSPAEIWSRLEIVSGMSQDYVAQTVGVKDIPVLAVAIHHFFENKQEFGRVFPEEAAVFRGIFKDE